MDTGGPAFPMPAYRYADGYGGIQVEPQSGMTLRDWFAGQALAGFLADSSQRLIAAAIEDDPDRALIQDSLAKAAVVNQQLAEGCYALADAMLAARHPKGAERAEGE